MSERDPRVDPKPGDVLRTTSGEDYRVIAVDRNGWVSDTPIDPKHPDFGGWQGFMINATVIERAPLEANNENDHRA